MNSEDSLIKSVRTASDKGFMHALSSHIQIHAASVSSKRTKWSLAVGIKAADGRTGIHFQSRTTCSPLLGQRLRLKKNATHPSAQNLLGTKISCFASPNCQRDDDAVRSGFGWPERPALLPEFKKKRSTGPRADNIKVAGLVPPVKAPFCLIIIKDRGAGEYVSQKKKIMMWVCQ